MNCDPSELCELLAEHARALHTALAAACDRVEGDSGWATARLERAILVVENLRRRLEVEAGSSSVE